MNGCIMKISRILRLTGLWLLSLALTGVLGQLENCDVNVDTVVCENLTFDNLPPVPPSVKSLYLNDAVLRKPILNQEALKHYRQLETLVIASNSLDSVERGAFQALSQNLTKVELTVKSVNAGAFNKLRLKKLRLDHLSASGLSPNAFNGIEDLAELELLSSGITDIDAALGSLANLNSLTRLNLENNKLETISSGLDKLMRKLTYLKLDGNPWQCDCDLAWLVARYNALWAKKSINDPPPSPQCHSPIELRDVPFSRLLPNMVAARSLKESDPSWLPDRDVFVLCPSVTLKSFDVDLKTVASSHVSSMQADIFCNVTGGSDLQIQWRHLNTRRPNLGPMHADIVTKAQTLQNENSLLMPRLRRNVSIMGLVRSWSKITVQRENDFDLYQCEVVNPRDSEDTVKTMIKVKWPPELSLPLTPAAETAPGTTPLMLGNGTFEKKYSLFELLGAVFATFTSTAILFCLVTQLGPRRRGLLCPGKTSKSANVDHQSTGGCYMPPNHSPNGTNSSNTSYAGTAGQAAAMLKLEQQNALLNSLLASPYLAPGGTMYQGAPVSGSMASPSQQRASPCPYESINSYGDLYQQQQIKPVPLIVGQTAAGTMLRAGMIPPPPNVPQPALPSDAYLEMLTMQQHQQHQQMMFNNPRTSTAGMLTPQQQQHLQYMSALAAANMMPASPLNASQSNLLQQQNR